jgi:hypothetical protein
MKKINNYKITKSMKYLLKSLLTVATFVLLLQSCVNTDYDFDNIDTAAVFKIPPIMLGSIEMKLADLDELPIGVMPPNIELPNLSVVVSETLYDIFGEEVVENFFFDGAGAFAIEAREVNLNLPLSGARIDLFFNVLDSEGNSLPGVNIPRRHLIAGQQGQRLLIEIDEQSMRYMNNAQSLEIVLAISSPAGATLEIDGASSLELNNVIIRTGGIRFDLFE